MTNRFPLVLAVILTAIPVRAEAPKEFSPLPVAVSSFGAAVAGDYVYEYGGHCGATHAYSTADVVGTFRRLKLSDPTKWEDLPGGPSLQGLALEFSLALIALWLLRADFRRRPAAVPSHDG